MKIVKNIILSVSILVLSSQLSFSFPQPFVDFPERWLGTHNPVGINSISPEIGFYKRMLGNNEADLFNFPYRNDFNIEKRITGLDGNYNILVLNLQEIKMDYIYFKIIK